MYIFVGKWFSIRINTCLWEYIRMQIFWQIASMNATGTLFISLVHCTEDLELVRRGMGVRLHMMHAFVQFLNIMGLPVSQCTDHCTENI